MEEQRKAQRMGRAALVVGGRQEALERRQGQAVGKFGSGGG